MNIITLPEVASTSTFLRETMPDAPAGTVIAARSQTAGRGQRGNSWEAEPGCNLTFSILLRPEGIEAARQYAVSEAVAVAVTDVIAPMVPHPAELTIKWPNDIYYGDRKICGILIENTLNGRMIMRSIAGVGININQREFRSDAPNPVSLWQITGREYLLEPLLATVADAITARVEQTATAPGRDAVAALYKSRLWRREGMHPYSLPDGTRFMAAIAGVAPTGHLSLRHADGTVTVHAFKEVAAIL